MLLLNGNPLPDPYEMRMEASPKEGSGLMRGLEIAWARILLHEAAEILGPCGAPLNLTFTDPVTGARQTREMGLVSATCQWAHEGAEGTVFGLLRLFLNEA